MRRFALVMLFSLIFALPTLAQTDLGATYTLDTGTSIDYPEGWVADLQDNLVILSRSDISRAIIIDYPLVSMFTQVEPTLDIAVSAVADQIFEGNYDAQLITPFTILGREAARYDITAGPDTSGGAIIAVRFSNNRIGMLIAINVSESTLESMLQSFDNTSPANDNVVVPSGPTRAASSVSDTYFYQAGGRLIIPAGWSATPRLLGNEIEYVQLQTVDGSTTALAFDLSNTVGNSLALDTVAAASGINFQNEFDLTFGNGEFVHIDNRDVYRYSATLNGQVATMTVVHFDDGGTGLVIVYGDTTAYAHDINMLLGSFTNLGALMSYIQ